MKTSEVHTLPRWMFLFLSVGGAWASGIYLGKLTTEGTTTGLLLPLVGFAVMGLLMAWGALSVD